MTNLFCDRLREERKRLGLKQQECADVLCVNRVSQNNYETGKRFPDVLYLENAGKIGMDIGYLVTGQRSVMTLAMNESEMLTHYRQCDKPFQDVLLAACVKLSTKEEIDKR